MGLLSAFIVADKVDVYSRRAGTRQAKACTGLRRARAKQRPPSEKADRGTKIVLHLKPGESEFADGWRLRNIIKKYLTISPLPIELPKEQTVAEGEEVPALEWETVNRASASWTRPRTEVKDEELPGVLQAHRPDYENPLAWSHNKVGAASLNTARRCMCRPVHRLICTSKAPKA